MYDIYSSRSWIRSLNSDLQLGGAGADRNNLLLEHTFFKYSALACEHMKWTPDSICSK
jgi:hypothetical protein